MNEEKEFQQPAEDGLRVTPHEFFMPGHGMNAGTGILLVHGLTGAPNEMRQLGLSLNRVGFTVYGVQLAGHCGTPEDLVRTRWQDWAMSVHAGALRLRGQVDRLVVMGLSMGAVLALELASERPELVDGVGAFSTMFWHDGWSMPSYARLSFLLRPFRALGIGRKKMFMEREPYGIKNETTRKRVVGQMQQGDSASAGLRGNPWYSVIEMHALSKNVRQRLGRVKAPCLVMHASQDDIASIANAELILRKVRAPIDFVLLRDSYHMITIDGERRTVFAHAAGFASRVTASSVEAPVRPRDSFAIPSSDASSRIKLDSMTA
ncbi:Thermostable monoacylglycerol lipase [Variovorax boronicumulans]|uniref:alpha/beta hydrolase n=1 Tax=Variovorax boronicumulans TaxID=436515 RepID=UPI000BB3DB05|nr:alpha/beta fold hydrolase [Variovorax boronicumulans]PBI89304.1 Thermostable monoacylglycerol lipase [Variovorax boronicumulans]